MTDPVEKFKSFIIIRKMNIFKKIKDQISKDLNYIDANLSQNFAAFMKESQRYSEMDQECKLNCHSFCVINKFFSLSFYSEVKWNFPHPNGVNEK